MEKELLITVKAPCECTEEQYMEWVKFELGYTCSISIENPLHEYDLEANNIQPY
jgi:hypothetical protein